MNVYAPPEPLSASAKQPGDEPLPGYRLLEPLGRGGFGEVWKCEAPGGLHKAIKFVGSDEANQSLRQEYEAFQQIKAIRHPFLLQLERVELTEEELIMVMELADSQLQERFLECRNNGLPGIPRVELLAYLADAAEALDVISVRHGLQHLDVKPANLFIICGRVKVGDYGLVRAESTKSTLQNRGFTPRYVAPEVLRGCVDARSDQYSLALVYQELLTGTFAYTARTAQQMMMAHASSPPDLSSLPMEDIGPMSIALAKQPEDRHPSCLAFVQALMMGGDTAPRHDTLKPNDTATVGSLRMTRVQTASGYLSRPQPAPLTRPAPSGSVPLVTPAQRQPYGTPAPQFSPPAAFAPPPPQLGSTAGIGPPAARQSNGFGKKSFSAPPVHRPGMESFAVPPAPMGSPQSPGAATSRSIVPDEPLELVLSTPARKVRLTDGLLRSVLPINVLNGLNLVPASVGGDWFVNTLVAAAIGETDSLGRNATGAWTVRIRTTHPVSVARQKLESMMTDEWFDEIHDRELNRLTLKRFARGGLLGRFSAKKSGLELDVTWPGGRVGEVELTARFFGEVDPKFARGIAEAMPRLFNEIRMLLKSGEERRKDIRIPVTFAVTLYPLKDDGEVQSPQSGRLRNISTGGLALTTCIPLPTRYLYVEFPETPDLAGLAILAKMLRSQPSAGEHQYSGKFRTDL